MNIRLVTLSAMVLMFVAACDQKTEVASKALDAGKEAKQKIEQSAQQATQELGQQIEDKSKQVTNAVSVTTSHVVEAAKEGGAAGKEATEQALADTVKHAQEVTNSQKSESRQRAQKSEDEMMELTGHK